MSKSVKDGNGKLVNSSDIFKLNRDMNDILVRELMSYRQKSESFVKQMDPEETKIIKDYQNQSYSLLNQILRSNGGEALENIDLEDLWVWSGFSDTGMMIQQVSISMFDVMIKAAQSKLKDEIKRLDNVFTKAPKLSKDTFLYRGMKGLNFSALKIGDYIDFPNYLSTSINPSIARRFVGEKEKGFKILKSLKSKKTSMKKGKNENEKAKCHAELSGKSLSELQNYSIYEKGVLLVIKAPSGTPFILLESVNKRVWEFEMLLERGYRLKIVEKKLMKDFHSANLLVWHNIFETERDNSYLIDGDLHDDKDIQWNEIGVIFGDLVQEEEKINTNMEKKSGKAKGNEMKEVKEAKETNKYCKKIKRPFHEIEIPMDVPIIVDYLAISTPP